jgi:WD40 repeat protein
LKGHSDYINSIVYEPEVGDMVVTASDDHTARVWDTKADISKALIHTFSLNSPGRSYILYATLPNIIHIFYTTQSNVYLRVKTVQIFNYIINAFVKKKRPLNRYFFRKGFFVYFVGR